jgi:soluble lytic murein transglycosylase-like protein
MQQRLASFLADPTERLDLLTRIHQQASELNLPPELVLSVIEVESAFDRYAISRVGAQGLMQVMPFWKDEIGRRTITWPTPRPTSVMVVISSASIWVEKIRT